MKKEELLAKMNAGEQLSPLELALLDSFLEDAGPTLAALKAASDELPSLAWRSALNQKLAAATQVKRTSWRVKLALGSFATAAASLALFIALNKTPSTSEQPAEISQDLIQWHQEAVASKTPSARNGPNSNSDLFGESVSSL